MNTKTDGSTLSLTSIGIDIGKDVFHLVGFDDEGKLALRRKIRRSALVKEFEKLPPLHCRHGGLHERSLCQPGITKARL